MAVYAVPIQPIRVNPPNYDFKELGEGLDTIRNWRTGRAVGEKLTGNDLRGASVAAFSGGDMRTGLDLQRQQQQQAESEARLAMERSRIGMESRRLDLLTQERDREEQTRQMTILGNLAETVRGIQDPEQRRQAWGRLVASQPRLAETLQRYGVDPTDDARGPDFIIGQTRDPLQRRQVEATIEYNRQRGTAREMDAETRRLKALYDQFQAQLGDSPSEEAWNQANQPGGIIQQIAGRLVPFSEAPSLVQQVQSRRRAIVPSEDELSALGLNPAQLSTLRRRAALRNLLGSPGPGYNWDIDENGRVQRIQEGREDPRNPVSTEQIQFNIEQLRDAFTLLAGTTNAQGRLDTRGTSGPTTRMLSQAPIVGGYIAPATNEAFRAAEHAALNLSYALSGRTIGQVEQGRILELFVPKAGESPEISAFKLDAAMNLFNRLLRARGRPAPERAQMFDSELVLQSRALRRARELEESRRSGRPAPPAERPQPGSSPATDLSDEELLRRLGVK